jgi:hypothetical protein
MGTLHRTTLFIVLGVVVILALVLGYVWMRAHNKKAKAEPFETNLDSIYNIVTDGGDDALDVNANYVYNEGTNELDEKKPIESRTCALYYTENVELCDDTINNWYVRPMTELRRYRDQLNALTNRSAFQDEQLDAVNRVIVDRESGNLPRGICKVEFPGWVEPKVTASGEPYPYKNKALFENTNRLLPEDWAFCFKPAENVEDAIAQSKNFADEYVVKSFDYAGDYFQDGKVYSKIAFTTINLDANMPSGAVARAPRATSVNSFVCATQPPPIPNVPSTMLIFELTGDVLRSMYIGTYNKDTLAFEQTDDSQVVFQGLFDTRLSGRSLYLVPKILVGSIYQFAFDVCGRLTGNDSLGTEFSISLMRDLGIQPRLLYTAPSTTSATYGTLDQLKERVSEYNTQIMQISSEVTAANALSTTPQYRPGHVRYTYRLDMNDPPSMANASALDIIFKGVDPMTQLPNSTIINREIIQSSPSERTYAQDTSRVKYGYVLEGYINIGSSSSARYYFNLNTDDGGDFMIEDTVVASHYNYHVMNNNGVKESFRLERNKYYKFRARFAQWMGGSGIAVQWKTGTQATYTDIPANVLYYDENDTIRYQASLRQKEASTIASNKALVEQTIDTIEKRRNQFMKIAFQGIGNRRMTQWKDYVSVDGKLYVDIGSLEGVLGRSDEQALGQVILQEQSTSIVGGVKEFPSPVSRLDGMVQYSLSFWIYIGETFNTWTNIFYHGVHDNWTLIPQGDRTPGIWLYPNSSRIHFRQRSSASGNDGCDTLNALPMNRWVHFTAVVNGTNESVLDQPRQSIQLYVDGQKLMGAAGGTNFKQLGNAAVWHWGQQTGKKARIAFNGARATNKGVFVQKVYWYNRILSADEVLDIYNNSGVLRNRKSVCRTLESEANDTNGWKTSALANLNVQCQKDEVLSSVTLTNAGNNKAKYNFECCRIESDDPIKVTTSKATTPSSWYSNGSVSMLAEQNVNCQNNGLQQMKLTANPDRDFAYYDYTCGVFSSGVNMNVKCTPKSTAWTNDNGTLQPLVSTQVKCGEQEYISQMKVARDTNNGKIRYDYSCCEVGGL